MANLFGRLFKGGEKKEEQRQQPQKAPKAAKNKREAFFLDADSAKTYGDIEYMRKPAKIRHTFPKFSGKEGFAVTKEISSVEARLVDENAPSQASQTFSSPKTTSSNSSSASASQPRNQETERRRQSSKDLDMFRNMAKDLRKR